MKTDDQQSPPHFRPDSAEQARTPVKRGTVQIGLSILNPFSDLMVMYRTGMKPCIEKLRILRELVTRSQASKEQLSWAQALACTGRTVPQLLSTFRRKRTAWWCLMTVSGVVAFILLLSILYNSSSLPPDILWRAFMTDIALTFAGLLGLVKLIETNYRLWQLCSQRVSISERGTFQDYRAEVDLGLQVMTFSSPY